jgi:hypothetical protein
MNTLVAFELARHEQEARIRHAMHVRAVKAYRRDHPVEHYRRQRVAALLRRWATRLDGRTATALAPRGAGSVRRLSTR